MVLKKEKYYFLYQSLAILSLIERIFSLSFFCPLCTRTLWYLAESLNILTKKECQKIILHFLLYPPPIYDVCCASSISVAWFWHCSISNLCDQVPSLLGASHLSLRKFFSPLTDNNTKQNASSLFIIFCCKKRIGKIYKPMEGGYIAVIYQNMCEGTNNSLHI